MSTDFNDLSDKKQTLLLHCNIMKIGSVGLNFDGTVLKDWAAAVECLEQGLVEIFIGEDQGSPRKGEACARMRLTPKGRALIPGCEV